MAGHPVTRDIRQENRLIAAALHVARCPEHGDDVRAAARDGCTNCRRYDAESESGPLALGLYDFTPERRYRADEDDIPLTQFLARRIEDIAKMEGKVCPCHGDLAAFGGPKSKLPSAFAKAARGGKIKRDPLSEHKSARRGVDGTPGRNSARCSKYNWVGIG